MDGSRFDTLARSFSATGSRRRALAAIIGAVLGTFGLTHTHDAAAAKSGKCRRRLGECERCQRGTCEHKNGEKRCKAGSRGCDEYQVLPFQNDKSSQAEFY